MPFKLTTVSESSPTQMLPGTLLLWAFMEVMTETWLIKSLAPLVIEPNLQSLSLSWRWGCELGLKVQTLCSMTGFLWE